VFSRRRSATFRLRRPRERGRVTGDPSRWAAGVVRPCPSGAVATRRLSPRLRGPPERTCRSSWRGGGASPAGRFQQLLLAGGLFRVRQAHRRRGSLTPGRGNWSSYPPHKPRRGREGGRGRARGESTTSRPRGLAYQAGCTANGRPPGSTCLGRGPPGRAERPCSYRTAGHGAVDRGGRAYDLYYLQRHGRARLERARPGASCGRPPAHALGPASTWRDPGTSIPGCPLTSAGRAREGQGRQGKGRGGQGRDEGQHGGASTVAQGPWVRFPGPPQRSGARDDVEQRLIPRLLRHLSGTAKRGGGVGQALLEAHATGFPAEPAVLHGPRQRARRWCTRRLGFGPDEENRPARAFACTRVPSARGSTNHGDRKPARSRRSNRIPVLLLPSDFFATPGAASPGCWQELEGPPARTTWSVKPTRFQAGSRGSGTGLNRPEQAAVGGHLLAAMRVPHRPGPETGAGGRWRLPQDVQGGRRTTGLPGTCSGRRGLGPCPRPGARACPPWAPGPRGVAAANQRRKPADRGRAGGRPSTPRRPRALRKPRAEATGIPVVGHPGRARGRGLGLGPPRGARSGAVGATGLRRVSRNAAWPRRGRRPILGDRQPRYSDFTTASRHRFPETLTSGFVKPQHRGGVRRGESHGGRRTHRRNAAGPALEALAETMSGYGVDRTRTPAACGELGPAGWAAGWSTRRVPPSATQPRPGGRPRFSGRASNGVSCRRRDVRPSRAAREACRETLQMLVGVPRDPKQVPRRVRLLVHGV